jgi:hypothetical protein
MPPSPGGNRLGDLGPIAPHGFGVTKDVHELLAGHGTAHCGTIRDIVVEQHQEMNQEKPKRLTERPGNLFYR